MGRSAAVATLVTPVKSPATSVAASRRVFSPPPTEAIWSGFDGHRPMGYRPLQRAPHVFYARKGAPGAVRGAFVAAAKSSMVDPCSLRRSSSEAWGRDLMEVSTQFLSTSTSQLSKSGSSQQRSRSSAGRPKAQHPQAAFVPSHSRPPPNVVEFVAQLSASGDWKQHQRVAEALQGLLTIAVDTSGISSIVASHAAEPLVAIVADTPTVGAELVLLRTLSLMVEITTLSAGRATILAAGGVPALVALLARGAGDILELTVAVLAGLASDRAGGDSAEKVRSDMVTCGVVPPLVRMLGESPKCIGITCRALANLTEFPGSCHYVVAAGAVGPMVSLLRGEDVELQVEAARALANIAQTNKGRRTAFEEGALPVLSAHIDRGPARLKRPAAAAIAAVMGRDPKDYPHGVLDDVDDVVLPLEGKVLLRARVLEPVVRLLRHGPDQECKTEATHAIMQMAQSVPMHEAVLAAGVLPLLVEQLESECPRSQGYAGAALQLLGSTPEQRKIVQDVVNAALKDADGELGWTGQARRENLLNRFRSYCL